MFGYHWISNSARDTDPIKNRLRANQLKYWLNHPVDDRRSHNNHPIVHCVGIGVVPSAAQAEVSDSTPNVFKYLKAI